MGSFGDDAQHCDGTFNAHAQLRLIGWGAGRRLTLGQRADLGVAGPEVDGAAGEAQRAQRRVWRQLSGKQVQLHQVLVRRKACGQ